MARRLSPLSRSLVVTGRFITLEGGEGAGKSTQARLLADSLCALGLPVLRTREPGGAPGAELLRGMLLDGAISWASRTEALLHFAARAEHVEKTIRPALSTGIWVVCDRFSDCTMTYQGYGLGADRSLISILTGLIGLVPDLTLILDVDATTAAKRLGRRRRTADRYERMDSAFHARVRAGFRAIAAGEPARCCLIPAAGSRESIQRDLLTAARAQLGLPNSVGGPKYR